MPRRFEVSRRAVCAVLLLAVVLGILVGDRSKAGAQAQSAQDAGQITFFNNTMADFSATSGEPIIKVDPKDQIFVTTPFGLSTTLSLLWRSSDGGRTFVPLGGPAPRDAVTGPGGGDTDVDFDDKGRVYYVDLSAACVTAAVSLDGGNTFPAERTNHLTCVSDEHPEAATDDRQWIAAFGDGIAYATWRNFQGSSFWMFKTKDAGLTWDKGTLLGPVGQSGPLRIDKKKRRVMVGGQEKEAVLLYQVYYSGNNVRLFRVTDVEGSAPVVENFSIYNGTSDISNVFPVLAVDTSGNLYAAWSQVGGANGTSHTIWMATSTDRGQTWSPRKQVSTFTGTNIMPWIVAGDPGRLNVVWYRGSMPNNPNSPGNVWQIYMAQTLNAFDAAPTFTTVPVSQNAVHRGEICTDGLTCDVTGRDRSFLEYPSVWIDSKGAAVVVYNDNTNQSEGPYVMTARQATGPSLLTSVGTLGTEPGTVALSAPAANTLVKTDTLSVEGSHTLPPKNFDRDEAGDARYKPTGVSLPGADLRSVSLREEGDSLVLDMQVADLSSSAVTNAAVASEGTGLLYLTQWDYADTIYWLAAEMRGGTTSFYTGTLGMIRSATSKKFVTYNPDLSKSQQVRGQVRGNTITVSIPKALVGSPAQGVPFHTVTGYALSERAPLMPVGADLPNGPAPAPQTTSLLPDPTSLPVMLDASGAATYTAGDGGPLTNGVVEVSYDDPTFATPRVATLSTDPASNRWQVSLSASELTPGAHTVYARQRIAGRGYSPLASVSFNVSETVERVVTPLTSLTARGASSSAGVASYDLLVRNTSAAGISAPLFARVTRLTSGSGSVTVANADNGQTGVGAAFDYGAQLGADNLLSPGETSAPRRLRFNNPNNEPFTAEFEVIGQLPRGSAAAAQTAPTANSNASMNQTGSGAGTQSASPTAALLGTVLRVTYNPLLNTTTVEVVGR